MEYIQYTNLSFLNNTICLEFKENRQNSIKLILSSITQLKMFSEIFDVLKAIHLLLNLAKDENQSKKSLSWGRLCLFRDRYLLGHFEY